MQNARERLEALLTERIAVLDGSWGVLLQNRGLTEEEWRGERFRDHARDVKGDPDLLNLTRPEIVESVHRAYFEAGADIATTNTFTATSIGQADYALEASVRDMNLEGARLARKVADEHDGFVAGSVGPLNVTLSLSPKVEDPAYRAVRFEDVVEAYTEQMVALRDGGVDLLLIETIFDTLNAKAAIAAAREAVPELPLWISFTAIDRSGRNLSGQTVEAFWISVEHARPLIVGVNCSVGAREMRPVIEALSRTATTWVSCHPNAGLPNALGTYDEQPDETSALLGEFATEGFLNVVGGCCGTTPEHTAKIAAAVKGLPPRTIAAPPRRPRFSGLEPFEIGPDTGFVMIGERTNVTGSARFRSLVEAGDYGAAVEVALEQVRGGANLLDVNMDADLLDAVEAMTTFLKLIASEPEVARIPIVVDSSRFGVLEAGLECVQGKGIANSISLKEGEESFLAQAGRLRELGAAVIVMAFDEQGQADTVERKVAICERAYKLLVEQLDFAPEDIVFDPNVLAVATGIEEHAGLREGVHRRDPADQGALSRRAHLGRDLEPLVRVPRQRPRPRGDARRLPLPRDPRRPRHGDRQRRAADGLRGHRARAARARRGRPLRPPARRDRAPRRVRGPRQGRGDEARGRPLLARGAGRRAPLVRARARRGRLHRGGHRGGAAAARAAARRDRGPADGRHGDRRRPLREREDVPAAGREERPRDEARRRLPRAVHGGGEGAHRPRARRRARSCSRPSRATCTTSARTSSASCSAATTTRCSTSA